MARRTLDIQFPAGGQSQRLAYQRQRPFTTPFSTNVRATDVLESRQRGGSRPGLVKSYVNQDPFPLGGGQPIRLLTMMRSLNTSGRVSFSEPFDDNPMSSTNWENIAALAGADGLFDTATELGVGGTPGDEDRNAILKTVITDLIDTNASYTQSLRLLASTNTSSIFPRPELNNTTLWSLFAGLDDASPSSSDYVVGTLLYTFNGALSADNRGKLQITSQPSGANIGPTIFWSSSGGGATNVNDLPGPGTLSLIISPQGIATLTWSSADITFSISLDVSADIGLSGKKRVGMAVDRNTGTSTAILRVDDYRLSYTTIAGGVPSEAIIASANGLLYRESTAGGLTVVTQTGITLASDRALQAVDRLGKLYIADFGVRLEKTDGSGAIVDGVLDAAGVSWTSLGIEDDGDVVEITSITGGTGIFAPGTPIVTSAVMAISSVDNADGITLKQLDGTALSSADDVATCNFRVLRGAKVYDSDTDAMTLWVADNISANDVTAGVPLGDEGDPKGIVPIACNLIKLWQDRIVMGGDPNNEGVWYMSRQGDVFDFLYGQADTDRRRAIAATSTDSDAGFLPIPLTNIAPISEDYILFSGISESYLLRGEPTFGGGFQNVSRQIGIGAANAFCQTPDGTLVALARDGLYRVVVVGDASRQVKYEPLSRDRLPREFIDLVQDHLNHVSMEYDTREVGIQIAISPESVGVSSHWWFDWRTGGFFSVVVGLPSLDPFALIADAKANRVLAGCRDGHIREFSKDALIDDGVTLNSNVWIGPIMLGVGGYGEGIIIDVDIILDEQSADATISCYVGSSPEAALKSTSFAFKTLTAGRTVFRPMARGVAAFFKIQATSGATPNNHWAMESMRVRLETLGDLRT